MSDHIERFYGMNCLLVRSADNDVERVTNFEVLVYCTVSLRAHFQRSMETTYCT